ncbi:MAG: hypothetical protein IPH44_42220 [Myxococcales bacterium]|jgi:hypothetical protein|nr:hypothetical protein [Myxococcales bacterium]MBK7192988.1 hypothetical protein [Myxococcales bacterium]MBP6844154.1 hypothetical protein [Kofleriaceae bacterium]
MRANTSILLVTLVAACAGSAPAPERPKSYREHMDEAAAHDRDAEVHEAIASDAERAGRGSASYACGNQALSDQTTSGGERVTSWVPCWSVANDASATHEAEAERLRTEAQQHRAIARNLLDVERTFCAGLPADELTHSPLYHRHDIASVEAYREGGDLAGARVTFKAVPGLSPAYLSHALLCHRARMATLGYPTTYMAYDPAMLVHTHLAVDDQGGPIVVTIRADDDVTAAAVWSRAQALLNQR